MAPSFLRPTPEDSPLKLPGFEATPINFFGFALRCSESCCAVRSVAARGSRRLSPDSRLFEEAEQTPRGYPRIPCAQVSLHRQISTKTTAASRAGSRRVRADRETVCESLVLFLTLASVATAAQLWSDIKLSPGGPIGTWDGATS